jgi:site-specific DNA-methyltransferase (adenine-specific)
MALQENRGGEVTFPDDYINKILCGDCLQVMKDIPDNSIDMVLTDPPYGTTACSWDSIIPLDLMWEQLKRIIKNKGAIVLFGSQPFTTKLINSNINMFKYEWIWNKTFGKDPFATNRRPMKSHENILLFYYSQPVFNPQKTKGIPYSDKRKGIKINAQHYNKDRIGIFNEGTREPISVLKINHTNFNQYHPTQKPVSLIEYLVITYTNKNDLVLDFCIGSGTTAVACKNTHRRFIGIEQSPEYCKIAEERLRQEVLKF